MHMWLFLLFGRKIHEIKIIQKGANDSKGYESEGYELISDGYESFGIANLERKVLKMKTTAERIEEFYGLMHPYISKEFYQWLIQNGFFTAPASRKYHGDYIGGLYDHSHAVTESLVEMTEKLGLEWQNERSPYIVGMLHDLCKIDQYVKVIDVEGVHYFGMDEPQGEEFHFEYSKDIVIPGHGDKSVMLLSQHMQLTEEEILCVRYHMGSYETKDWEFYDKAIKKYQTVLFTHTADMHASKVKGI